MDWIKNAYPEYEIRNETPRLILIAKNFPNEVVTLAKYISGTITKVDLYSYKAVKIGEKVEIICNDFPIPLKPEIIEKPKKPEEIISYIKNEEVKKECIKVREYIKNVFVKNIEESPTKYSLTYKYKGKNVCQIDPRRDFFWLGWRNISGEWKTERDITSFEDVKKIIDGEIKEFFEQVKGGR